MALVPFTAVSQSFPEGEVHVGYDYDDVDLKVYRVWGFATFATTWAVTFVDEMAQVELWSGTLTTVEAARSLNPQQRIQMTVDSEGARIMPVSIRLSRVA